MTWQADGNKKITRRTFVMGGVQLLLAFTLFGRMFYLQVLEADKYQTLADKNRISLKLLPPPRGAILDRNGIPFAMNRKIFRAMIVAEETGGKLRKTLQNFGKLVPLQEEDYERILKEIKRKKSFVPVRLKDDLSFDEMAAIQLNIPDLAGVSIENGLMRVYPQKEFAAHPVGYVSFVTEQDLEQENLLSKMPDIRIGRTGIEQSYQDFLYGETGNKKMEINAVGREIRELEKTDPIPGKDLILTLDSRLQKAGYEALKNESGSAVLIDVQTGEVKMMVSTPSFDPNIFNEPVDTKTWSRLNTSDRHPLLNKAISGLYSPGSVFKIVVALAGLEAGVITEKTKIDCEGRLFVGEHPFHCWKRSGHGPLNLKQALQHSCDIYFYEVARQTGVDKIIEVAERLGFGHKTGIDLFGEKEGLIPSRAWKEGRFGDAWRLGDTMNLGIGQGFLLATPLQMALMMAHVANGGKKLTPVLSMDARKEPEKLQISSRHLRIIREGLTAVVNKPGGTAYHARIDVDGQKMAGKTASTQIRRISLAEREKGLKKQSELPWKDRDHAFFVAYAPLEHPKYAISVAVEHGGGGGAISAPIAGIIMQRALELDKEDREKSK